MAHKSKVHELFNEISGEVCDFIYFQSISSKFEICFAFMNSHTRDINSTNLIGRRPYAYSIL